LIDVNHFVKIRNKFKKISNKSYAVLKLSVICMTKLLTVQIVV